MYDWYKPHACIWLREPRRKNRRVVRQSDPSTTRETIRRVHRPPGVEHTLTLMWAEAAAAWRCLGDSLGAKRTTDTSG